MDEAGADATVALAERLLDLDAIATGPSTAFGMGPGFEPHFCLGWVVGSMGPFPGKGTRLIRLALQSPSNLNRVWTICALALWPTEYLTAELEESVRGCLNDSNERVRAESSKMLERIAASREAR